MYWYCIAGTYAIMGFIYKKIIDQEFELYERYGDSYRGMRRAYRDDLSDSDSDSNSDW